MINILKTQTPVHSFIFYGPNGTGKTTSARLFSRAINCRKFKEIGEICEQCTNCKVSSIKNCIDIIEIDGATNNGVEFVREINKNALYPPLKLSKKLYIIDEAHCLSIQSWNALLKLIEEPPDYLIIILITTEIQKIIPTIMSRCQKLNFPALDYKTITPLLSKICMEEKHSIKEVLLENIVKNSRGSVRESLVMLEKLFLNNSKNYASDFSSDNEDAMHLLQLIFDTQSTNALIKLKKIEKNFSAIFESILNYLLELSFYILGKKSDAFLTVFSKQEAEILLNKKKDISSMINFLATNIYPPSSNFSITYAKFLLLNLLELSSKNYEDVRKKHTVFSTPEVKYISKVEKNEEVINNEKYGKTPLKAVLSETISDREANVQLPTPQEIFSNSLLAFCSFDLPQFKFQEILYKEERFLQILQKCEKSKGDKYYEELKVYLESENPIPLFTELFKKIHPKYKFICSDENCLVIFSDIKDSQYFNLKLKKLKVQEKIYTIFSSPLNFHSISLSEFPALLEKKKIHKFKKSNKNFLSAQEEKLFAKIQELFSPKQIMN